MIVPRGKSGHGGYDPNSEVAELLRGRETGESQKPNRAMAKLVAALPPEIPLPAKSCAPTSPSTIEFASDEEWSTVFDEIILGYVTHASLDDLSVLRNFTTFASDLLVSHKVRKVLAERLWNVKDFWRNELPEWYLLWAERGLLDRSLSEVRQGALNDLGDVRKITIKDRYYWQRVWFAVSCAFRTSMTTEEFTEVDRALNQIKKPSDRRVDRWIEKIAVERDAAYDRLAAQEADEQVPAFAACG